MPAALGAFRFLAAASASSSGVVPVAFARPSAWGRPSGERGGSGGQVLTTTMTLPGSDAPGWAHLVRAGPRRSARRAALENVERAKGRPGPVMRSITTPCLVIV